MIRYIKPDYTIANGNEDYLTLKLDNQGYLIPYYKLNQQSEYSKLPNEKIKFTPNTLSNEMSISDFEVSNLLDKAIIKEFLSNKSEHIKENLGIKIIPSCNKNVIIQFGFFRYENIVFYRGGNERHRHENVFYSLEDYPIEIREKPTFNRVSPERDLIFNALRLIGSRGISKIIIDEYFYKTYKLDTLQMKHYLDLFDDSILIETN